MICKLNSQMEFQDIKRVAIIGAGPAGICAAKHLHHNKYNDKKFDIVVYERQDQVGGLWVYNKEKTNANNISPMYKDMITNIPKQVSYFPDFPFPEENPTFMHHSLVLKHLQKYATDSNIEEFVCFQTEVTKVRPFFQSEKSMKWEIETKDLRTSAINKKEFDAVVVCSGINQNPLIINIEGSQYFKGRILHSYLFDDPLEFEGETVLIYGYGPSATDLVTILYRISKTVLISKRSKGGPNVNHPHNVKVIGNIKKINKNGEIEIEDHTLVQADSIILCTGYKLSYPFLSDECEIFFEENGKVLMPIYKHLFHAVYPTMVFVSLASKNPGFSVTYYRCNFVACIFSGHKQMPPLHERLADIEREKKKMADAGKPYSKFHALGSDSYNHINEIADFCELERLPESFMKLFDAVRANIDKDFYTAKRKDYSSLLN